MYLQSYDYLLITWLASDYPKCSWAKRLAFLLSVGKMEDEVKPKKLPRLRKANFFMLDEPILQREIEKKLWCDQGKVL